MHRYTLGMSSGYFSDKKQNYNTLFPRNKNKGKIGVYDYPDILAILRWKMGRAAQLQPEPQSPQGRHLLFLHTKRLEILGSRQIFCPTLEFVRFFRGHMSSCE